MEIFLLADLLCIAVVPIQLESQGLAVFEPEDQHLDSSYGSPKESEHSCVEDEEASLELDQVNQEAIHKEPAR